MIADQERAYSEFIRKNCACISEIKQTYQVNGQEFYQLWEGIENYEINTAKEKNNAAKVIKETIDDTIGWIFKELTTKADKFAATVLKKVKRLHLEEKEWEKAYQNFTTMLEEAEAWMNQGKSHEKDFWLAENQCLVTSKKQYDKQKELSEEVIDIWDKAEAMEEVRIRNLKVKIHSAYLISFML